MYLEWQQIGRLLVLVSLQNSDAVKVLPALQSLRQSLPQAQIHSLNLSLDASAAVQFEEIKIFSLPFQNSVSFDAYKLIQFIQNTSFDAAIIFTAPGQSPYSMAYCCYLAGIPIRCGQSSEFGGGVLSHQVQPPCDTVQAIDYHLHLLRSLGLSVSESITTAANQPTHSSESLNYATENSDLAHSR
ncbi:MAG TPA: hypothetical protein V6D10_11035 [Trichocoleus sp.]|jgi:ADP-heptose:LPS heptosyltransferase